jgi:signal transduction histidine kinase
LRPDATGGDRARPIDVAAVARRIQAMRVSGRGTLALDVPENILVWAHEDRLERVLSHLVQNAFDASGREPEVRLGASRDGGDVLIEVSDRGSGMTAEFIRERLFRPFQTTKDTGMGIGAFECQQYVQQIGGGIEVYSEPSVGTRVRVKLRAVAEAMPQEAAA